MLHKSTDAKESLTPTLLLRASASGLAVAHLVRVREQTFCFWRLANLQRRLDQRQLAYISPNVATWVPTGM